MPYNNHCCAGVAHLVERDLAKVEVASSSLVARSKKETTIRQDSGFFFCQVGQRLERARAQREKHAGGMFWCPCACGGPAGPPASLVARSKKHHPSRVVFFYSVCQGLRSPLGRFCASKTALGTLLFCVYFFPCGVPKGRVSTSGSRRMRRKSWQKAAYS